MTPTETLAAARLSTVGPFVQARAEGWTADWSGPALVRTRAEPEYGRGTVRVIPVVIENGCVLSGDDWFTAGEPGIFPVEAREYDALLLDLRRPEVRDLLVRCGCPAWARDVPAAVWAWAGGLLTGLYGPWRGVEWAANVEMRVAMHIDGKRAGPMVAEFDAIGLGAGWCVQPDLDPWTPADGAHGPETGADGRACADLAALRARCVLEEADGWYVPLPGGGVGWWPKNLEATP